MKKTICLILLCMLITVLILTACESRVTGEAISSFKICTPKWECRGTYKALKNANCRYTGLTYCGYGCLNGKCKPKPATNPPSSPRQLAACLEGWKCKTNNYRAYQRADCSWSPTETCLFGCLNGICKIPQQQQVCLEGWKCLNSKYKGYQSSNCNWDANRQEYCAESCSDGKCVCQPKWTCQGDNAIYKSADCKVSYPVVCPFGCSDGKCKSNPTKNYFAPNEYAQITGCEPFLGDKNAPLKILFVNLGNAPKYQQIVDDAVNNQFKAISPFKENINSVAFYSIDIPKEENECHITISGTFIGSGIVCDGFKVYSQINEKCKILNGNKRIAKGIITILITETEGPVAAFGGQPIMMGSYNSALYIRDHKNIIIHEVGHNFGLADLYLPFLRFDASPIGPIYPPQPDVLKEQLNVDSAGCSKWCKSYKPVFQYTQTKSANCLKLTKRDDCVKFGRDDKRFCEYSRETGAPNCCIWSDEKFDYFNTNCVPAGGSENIGIDCIDNAGCYFGAGHNNYQWRPILKNEESIMYKPGDSEKFDAISESHLKTIFECCLSLNANSEYCSNFRILYSENINNYNTIIGSCGYKD